ncbi:phosphohistidine phosphatase SixA [Pseudoduganella flava]|uniref:Histidine phosphatase family protein n=1 Tax=Pseudoduganella flava TaxID=871742 RepID=A0A562Q154_9BURK|nr:histidine phosphatase family protein [Pseudoduganella flava]QGZ38066.1 histidine phosphatase family protein [Pseudoduganella flava]TWI50425.1 phosphohistidine phosphatase SixA [Pseudoduganella flava]
MRRSIFRCVIAIATAAVLLPSLAFGSDGDALWNSLRDGRHVLLVRHAATEPGAGDPPGFQLDDCKTQRNLSAEGRLDAEAIGTAIRAHGVPVGPVLTSRWCRCIDTAMLAFARADPIAMLNSGMDDDDGARNRKLGEVREYVQQYVASYKEPGNLVLVTHDVNIRALVGEKIAQGEMLVAAPQPDGSLKVIGKLGVPRNADAKRAM